MTYGKNPVKVEPMLPLTGLLAALNRSGAVAKKKPGKGNTLMGVLIGSMFLSGCSTLGNGGWHLPELGSSSGEAREYVDEFSLGLYATAGIGPSRLEPDTNQLAEWDADDRVEPAGQLTIGADLTKHFSVEAHTADLGSSGLSGPGGDGGRINYHVNGASALLYVGGNRHRFRRQGLTAFGRLGFGALENTPVGDVPFSQVNGTHVLFGGGLEYMTPIGVGVRAEGFVFDEDAQYAQLALMYRTGRKTEIIRPKLAQAKPAVVPPPPPPLPAAVVVAPPPPLPVAALPDPCEGLSGVLDGVQFHTNSSDLTDESQLILNDVVYGLNQCGGKQVEVSAHTDSVGSEAYNQTLSEGRAASVVDYLSSQGIQRSRLRPLAFGESSPIDSNDTREGRARNRRVELYAR